MLFGMQQHAVPKGTITGVIVCEDSGSPARLATVRLIAANGGSRFSSQTSLNGTFEIRGVAVGEYYVEVDYPGYVSPHNAMEEVPSMRIAVLGNESTSVSITLEKGSSLTGTVLYDDGSPAIGLLVRAVPIVSPASAFTEDEGGIQPKAITDDQGRFRLSGLPKGDYLVRVSFPADSARSMVPFYFGNTVDVKRAQRVFVPYRQTTGGIDIQLPKLDSLRRAPQ